MNYKALCERFQQQVTKIFIDSDKDLAAREDSRAFGAMIEHKIKTNWELICSNCGVDPIDIPGRRTIYDFACDVDGVVVGFDIKTKDLDSSSYSDGGVAAVGNLLKFMVNDKGVFVVVEFVHEKSSGNKGRNLVYIRIAPFHCLPGGCYRIENLGTGQLRLNGTLNDVWEEIDWDRSYHDFFELFSALTVQHYRRVADDASKRIESIVAFRKNKYASFKFIK